MTPLGLYNRRHGGHEQQQQGRAGVEDGDEFLHEHIEDRQLLAVLRIAGRIPRHRWESGSKGSIQSDWLT